MQRLRRYGFTLVELLVVLAIISILVGLLLPAVQQVREAARRVDCMNRMRNVSLAGMKYESARNQIPGAWFNAAPDSGDYNRDMGLFVQLLPYLEQQSLFETFDNSRPSVSSANQHAIENTPKILICPTSSLSQLNDLADRFSGLTVSELTSHTCDYVGSGGYYDEQVFLQSDKWKGCIVPSISQFVAPIGWQAVYDGLSNTAFFWESAGGRLKLASSSAHFEFDLNARDSFNLSVGNHVFESQGQPSTKSYLHCWAGVRTGTVAAYDSSGKLGSPQSDPAFSSTINAANDFGQPFSEHPLGCVFAYADGSVRFLAEQTDALVVFSAASREGND